jgi:hypothetical protein
MKQRGEARTHDVSTVARILAIVVPTRVPGAVRKSVYGAACIAQRYGVERAGGTPELRGMVAMRPKDGMPMTIKKRPMPAARERAAAE